MPVIPQQNAASSETYLEPRRRPRFRRGALVMIAVLAGGIAIAACGGGHSTPGAATGSTTTSANSSPGDSTDATGLVAYSACMRSHGVPNFPDPASSGGISKQALITAEGDVSSAQVNKATNACEHLMPAGGLSGKPIQTITAQQQHYYLNAAACIRSHGFPNFPDPVFSSGSVNFPVPASIDTNSPQFTRAAHTCQKLIPAGLPDSGAAG